jgi:hypothetical protein
MTSGLGPDEGFGIIVVLGDVAVDGGPDFSDQAKCTALEATTSEHGEEGLSRIEPGGRGRGETETQRGSRASQASSLGCLCGA